MGAHHQGGAQVRRTGVRARVVTGLAVAGLIAAAVPAATPVAAQDGLPEIPREETFVFTPWGFATELPNPENWNPYIQGPAFNNQREMGLKGILEALFYTNLNTGELIPWQGESYEYNEDFTEVTLKLRDGVTWCDGTPMTSADVEYTLESLRDAEASVTYASIFAEWLEDVEVVDDLTSVIHLTKPGPRWFKDNLALGHENHIVMLPKHIFEGQDFASYNFFDLAAGLPCGTGPYKVVATSPQQYVADLRDEWWGVGKVADRMPNPKRLILIPVADDAAMSNLQITNAVDTGNPLQPGTFVAAKEQNPKIRSWAAEGPVWGAADGCGYNFIFNNMKAPWNDVNVRLAINYAIVRQQVSDIGYEGANYPIVLPFSAYMAPNWVPGRVQELLDQYDRGTPSPEKVVEHMTAAGYEKNADGKWAKDGEVLVVPVYGPTFFQPSFPIVQKNLQDAGFESTLEADPASDWVDKFTNGNHETLVLVHCGSLSDPFETLKDLHTKFTAPIGSPLPGSIIAGQRYSNPELDAILDKMEGMSPDSAQDSEYMDLVAAAVDIYLRDMPEIMLTEELHVVTYNETYWTGYPTADDPYIAPYPCWEAINLLIHRLEPAAA
ncbi:MAG: ABC transporter substrate-binding protein [Chloroflexota bacterium]